MSCANASGIFSAGSGCSVAIAIGYEILAVTHSENMHGQAEILLPLVDKAMHQAALAPASWLCEV